MACDNVLDLLVSESGRIGPETYALVFASSPWVGLVKRGAFPQGMGTSIGVLTYERNVPVTAEPTWSTVTPITQATEGGSCLPTPTKIAIGSTMRTFDLKRRVLEGPDFCWTDLMFAWQVRQQLEKVLSVLSEYTKNEWEIRYRHDYLDLVQNKTVVDANWKTTSTDTDASGSGYVAVCPTAALEQFMLNWAKVKLIRNGAGMSAMGRDNGSPTLTLMCSQETSDRLIFENEDIRQDIRYGKPSELLAPYGVERSYRGFYHLIDPYPIRTTCDGGAFTEVPAFALESATKGDKAVVNSAWEAADFEDSFIFDQSVFTSLIPEPTTNPAPNFRFDPVSYLGDWKLKNIPDRVCNPDGTIVFHRGTLGEAPMPALPHRGWAFRHLRCDPGGTLVTECGS